ncbi:hypothetical protein [Microbacterium paraoxydans]|uniref:LPXTG-motif cell wall anchor domain-containing protein n=1 Tax=Microbacterium paraoxydans TaxID=199592 RepID=A0ABS5IPY7_9MICO|nr:hypothetical protein [Microbacterium paraoxydans]MBS0024327.1 hypothetical protein [Microbacterium paraoxydans]
MRRRVALALAALPVGLALAAPAAAVAAPTTQVVQGQVLRLVSVADWEAAGDLRPDRPVQWDVQVSADAPDPGLVRLGVSATGTARLRLDVRLCPEPWRGDVCPAGAEALRTDWSVPRDGAEVPLTAIRDSETAHLRLTIALDPDDGSGSTEVRVLAHGAGESAAVGSGGTLAVTGPAPWLPLALAGGGLLLIGGFVARGRRERDRTGARP